MPTLVELRTATREIIYGRVAGVDDTFWTDTDDTDPSLNEAQRDTVMRLESEDMFTFFPGTAAFTGTLTPLPVDFLSHFEAISNAGQPFKLVELSEGNYIATNVPTLLATWTRICYYVGNSLVAKPSLASTLYYIANPTALNTNTGQPASVLPAALHDAFPWFAAYKMAQKSTISELRAAAKEFFEMYLAKIQAYKADTAGERAGKEKK